MEETKGGGSMAQFMGFLFRVINQIRPSIGFIADLMAISMSLKHRDRQWRKLLFVILFSTTISSIPFEQITVTLPPVISSGDYVVFGHYEQSFSEKDPIIWRVLTISDQKLLLFSDRILECRIFDTVSPNWSDSDIKTWLNGEFMSLAFTDHNEISAIDQISGVFLLSKTELTNEKYGFINAASRRALGTEHAYEQGLYIDKEGYGNYFTRTETDYGFVVCVLTSGGFNKNNSGLSYKANYVGIRPAIWVFIDALKISGGIGSLEKPYILDLKNK